MTLTNMVRIALFSTVVAGAGAAWAQGGAGGTPQTHHCKMADGSMDMKKTKKECVAAKGTWAKDAEPAKPADAPKAAGKDAPKDAPKADGKTDTKPADAPKATGKDTGKDAPKADVKPAPKSAAAPAPTPAPQNPTPAPTK